MVSKEYSFDSSSREAVLASGTNHRLGPGLPMVPKGEEAVGSVVTRRERASAEEALAMRGDSVRGLLKSQKAAQYLLPEEQLMERFSSLVWEVVKEFVSGSRVEREGDSTAVDRHSSEVEQVLDDVAAAAADEAVASQVDGRRTGSVHFDDSYPARMGVVVVGYGETRVSCKHSVEEGVIVRV